MFVTSLLAAGTTTRQTYVSTEPSRRLQEAWGPSSKVACNSQKTLRRLSEAQCTKSKKLSGPLQRGGDTVAALSCEDTVDAVSLCSDSGDAVDALGCEDTVDALSRCSGSGDTVVAFSLEDTVDALSLAASAKFKAQQTTPRSLGPFCNKVAFNRQRNSSDSQELSARSRRKTQRTSAAGAKSP